MRPLALLVEGRATVSPVRSDLIEVNRAPAGRPKVDVHAFEWAALSGRCAMDLFLVFVVLALIATAVTLGSGVVSMVRGGEYDRQHSTKLMMGRVGLQALTFVLLLLAIVAAAF